MKKGQIVEGIVERVEFPNKGIVSTEEGSCVVKNVLPGQKITFVINKKRNGRTEGRLLKVEENSPLEIESPCSHFGVCGGCTYLSLPYEEQLRIKKKQVQKLLNSVLDKQISPWQFEGIKESPVQCGYRNKMEFTFGDEYKDGPLALGMHKRGSFYDIVTVDACRIVDEDYRKILRFTRDYFDGVSFYHRLSHIGYLRHLLVRKAAKTGEILVALVTTSQEMNGDGTEVSKFKSMGRTVSAWRDKLLNLDLNGEIAGVLHIINDSVADTIRSDSMQVLYGQDYFYEELLGLKFKISVFSFFQTNSLGAEVLYETVREYIGDLKAIPENARSEEVQEAHSMPVVFDLYSGTGTIAQLMAPAAQKVIGVEIVEEAVEAARQNAKLNDLHNCEFIAGDVLKVLDEIKEKPDLIILDPPRDGVHPKALKKIISYGIERMVYISCKPTSLVRDLEAFLENGYVVEKAVAVDQFPWTANVEVIALLSRQKPDTTITVDLDISELYVTRSEAKATYEEIRDYVKEKYGLRVNNLYVAQIKRKHGIIERANYNLPKSENARQPKCPPEKEKAIVDALRHFKMIE